MPTGSERLSLYRLRIENGCGAAFSLPQRENQPLRVDTGALLIENAVLAWNGAVKSKRYTSAYFAVFPVEKLISQQFMMTAREQLGRWCAGTGTQV